MRKIISIFLLAIIFAVALSGCAQNNSLVSQSQPETKNQDVKKINIIATIFPQYDFARAIVGDKANLAMLVSPGSSIHSFDPSPADIKKIGNADVFIYIGGESDSWVDGILKSMDNPPKSVIRLMDYVKPVEEEMVEGMEPEADEHSPGNKKESSHNHSSKEGNQEQELSYDEHIWTSPSNAIKLINAITERLGEVDNKNADYYRQNAQNYINKIQEVDIEIKNIVKNAKRKKIIVADRFPFRYFVDEYGLDYRAAFGSCSDQTDASVATIAYLVNTVKNENIPYIYYVELSTQNVAKVLSEQTGKEMLLLHSCHNLSKSDFDSGATYLSLMKKNAVNLRKGLN